MKKKKTLQKVLLTAVLLAVGLLFLTPLLWMISSSLKMNKDVFALEFQWIPDEPKWNNYVKVLTSRGIPMLTMFKNSLYLAVMNMIGEILLCSMAAYAFAIIPFKGKNAVFLMLLAAMMVPGQATMIPKFMLFNWMGLYNNHWALILPSWLGISTIFMLRQFYMKVPKDLVEAARMDGASHFKIWMKVMLPLTKSAMTSVAILGFIGTWNDFMGPLIYLVDKDLFTVSLGINLYATDGSDTVNLIMAASTLSIIPIVIFFTAAQKQFIEGITSGAVKG